MYPKKKTPAERGQMIFMIVCLSFLLGTVGGAVAANLAGRSGEETLVRFLQEHLTAGGDSSFWYTFWKYMKYDLLIWAGGWLSMGVFISGCVCLFRGISLEFTAAMLMASYGGKGVWLTILGILPQNLLLIPAYVAMTTVAVYYLFAWGEEGTRKGASKREKRRRQTEYCILLAASVLPIVVASGVEVGLIPAFMAYLT